MKLIFFSVTNLLFLVYKCETNNLKQFLYLKLNCFLFPFGTFALLFQICSESLIPHIYSKNWEKTAVTDLMYVLYLLENFLYLFFLHFWLHIFSWHGFHLCAFYQSFIKVVKCHSNKNWQLHFFQWVASKKKKMKGLRSGSTAVIRFIKEAKQIMTWALLFFFVGCNTLIFQRRIQGFLQVSDFLWTL